MRHVFGVLVGLVVTALLLFGAGWAVQEAGVGLVPLPAESGPKIWIALGVMAAIGLLVGLVVVGRASPLATFVPSMVLLAWTVVYTLDVRRAMGLVPDDPTFHRLLLQAGRGMGLLLTTGVYALLGILLFLPVLMPSRWAPRFRDEEEYEESGEQDYR
ncbi:hypothetical protein [Streptosporangium amethystogenes]|uniref:hypothetical protein n=1 Tax=Streptosporangium amethystogenes TaxID=2002 RepID=UPI0004C6F249|nr:hypothetical protein [Streptosporangium amethystogenes]